MMLAQGVRIVRAGEGDDVAKIVRTARDAAKASGRDLVVYVGAPWCEPCQRFHKAAAHGDLDADFPTLTLLEFDAEGDGERLVGAGYTSKFVPLFALPDDTGHASSRRFEGSVKGDGAVGNITPRLRALLAH